jgi:hypothetical protein
MDSSIITVLAIILLILIVLNNITIISPTISSPTASTNASCSQTNFGCCPNGVDSKINYYGTNCPGYKPGPGYQPPQPYVKPPLPPPPPQPYVPPPPTPNPSPNPIGGCAGTRYGCCPNNNTPKFNEQGSNCLLK